MKAIGALGILRTVKKFSRKMLDLLQSRNTQKFNYFHYKIL